MNIDQEKELIQILFILFKHNGHTLAANKFIEIFPEHLNNVVELLKKRI